MRREISTTVAERELYRQVEECPSELYWLAYLITGTPERSVEAITRALDRPNGTTARSLLIEAALSTIESELRRSIFRLRKLDPSSVRLPLAWIQRITRPEFERALLAIDVFPRCALLLTVFEGLPLGDVALALHADKASVRRAQAQASLELTSNLARLRNWNTAQMTLNVQRYVSVPA